jgi:RNA polymerase sigma-70 factor (ECF subfamily)
MDPVTTSIRFEAFLSWRKRANAAGADETRELRLASTWDWDALGRQCRSEARRVLVSADDVDDAVQEALIRAWRHRDSCRSTAARGAWMRQIARNEAYRLQQQAKPGRQLDEADGLFEDDRQGEDLLQQIVVRAAIARLPAEDRMLAHLRYEADLEHLKIAGLLGMPEGTVKVRLHRIRQRLRPELASIV